MKDIYDKVSSLRYEKDTIKLLIGKGVYKIDRRNNKLKLTDSWKGRWNAWQNKAIREKLNRDSNMETKKDMVKEMIRQKQQKVTELQEEMQTYADMLKEIEEAEKKSQSPLIVGNL